MSEWQDISTAPRDGTELLLYCQREDGTGFRISGYFDAEFGEWLATTHDPIYPPVKWQPLPDPPQ